MSSRNGFVATGLLTVALAWAGVAPAHAHCDTKDGPVARDAAKAIARRDVTPALRWVKPAAEPEVRAAFRKALAVRGGGPEARELADTYFLETLVRLHRQGEGAPYTGLKPAGHVEPPVAATDAAIASGSVDALARRVADLAATGVRERFAHLMETRRHADDSVASGRTYVAAYVDLVHYVERLHPSAAGGDAHAEPKEADASQSPVHAH